MADASSAELLLCHACGEESWVRGSNHYDHHSLLCPSCGSDFVQILEEITPPERDSFPRSPHINPWADSDHSPWAEEDSLPHQRSAAYDPMEFAFPGYTHSHHTYSSPDGRFSFSGTTVRGSFPPRQAGTYSNPMIPMLQTLQTILSDISDTHDPDHAQNQQHQHQQRHHAEHASRSPRPDQSSRRYSPDPDRSGIDQFGDFEGLFPRDTNRSQRMEPPVESLADLLGNLHYNSAPRRRTGRPSPRTPMGPDPAMMLNALMRDFGEGRAPGRFGDAVYTQEAMNEVLAQLGQQVNHDAGPPPASTTAIRSLPKKKIDKQMLGSDGKAECAICKDTADIGTEVTILPCEHWFHFDCIEAWLSRHNTCPNCRRSIDSTASPGEGTSENPPASQDNPEPSPARRRRRSSPFSRSSRSIRSARSSLSRSSLSSPTQDTPEQTRSRRSSRSEGHHRGGITGWVWSRFGGGSG